MQSVSAYSVSTHMPLARHDPPVRPNRAEVTVSTHMPLARHDWIISFIKSSVDMFLLTCLLRGMTMPFMPIAWNRVQFLLTCLLRGMTKMLPYSVGCLSFLLTCLLRGMTLYLLPLLHDLPFLLTCLLRGMTWRWLFFCVFSGFYSHASCEA